MTMKKVGNFGRRPLRDGLSLRGVSALQGDKNYMSPSFTGRPFIEGRLWWRLGLVCGGSPSFTGRPFIEGHQQQRGKTRQRGKSPSFTGRPFIEGPQTCPE